MDDEEVAITGDEQDREGGEEHARRLDRSDQLAEDCLESWLLLSTSNSIPNHVLSESPIVGEDVDEGERHAERAEQDVGHRQRRDEHVPCCQHHLMVIMMILVIVMIILVFHIISVFLFWKLCKEVFSRCVIACRDAKKT